MNRLSTKTNKYAYISLYVPFPLVKVLRGRLKFSMFSMVSVFTSTNELATASYLGMPAASCVRSVMCYEACKLPFPALTKMSSEKRLSTTSQVKARVVLMVSIMQRKAREGWIIDRSSAAEQYPIKELTIALYVQCTARGFSPLVLLRFSSCHQNADVYCMLVQYSR